MNDTLGQHNDEVQTMSIWNGGNRPGHQHGHDLLQEASEKASELQPAEMPPYLTEDSLKNLLEKLSSEEIYRVKGFLRLRNSSSSGVGSEPEEEYYILNWAFGRYELHSVSSGMSDELRAEGVSVRLTVMGARGEMGMQAKVLAKSLKADIV